MNSNELKDKIFLAISKSGILTVNLSDINFTLVSKNTFDLTVDNNPLGIRAKIDDNDSSVSLIFDTKRLNKNKKNIDSQQIVEDAIQEYLNGT